MNGKKRKSLRLGIILLAAALVVSVVSFMILRYQILHDSEKTFTITLKENKASAGKKVTLEPTNQWMNDEGSSGETVGAQYDGTVYNNTNGTFVDWKMVITMPAEGDIDSSWNGTYVKEGNRITLVPDENCRTIEAHGSRTFGFVMISKELLDFEEIELEGRYESHFTQYPVFWLGVISAFVFVVATISYIVVWSQIRKYEQRRLNDAAIISQTMNTFAGLIDAKDPYTKGHSTRVAIYAAELARRMGLPESEVENISYIGLMHDCGKIGIPDKVLTKPEKLSSDERKMIEAHTLTGDRILEQFTAIPGIRDGARSHHERFDGTGYPDGLKGEEIPLCARIICVADSYDAMNSDRCYRKHLATEDIIFELKENAGTQFDPEIVPHMLAMIEDKTIGNLE